MAVAVVDMLEVVDVHQQQRARRNPARRRRARAAVCITDRKWRRLARLVSGSRSLCTRNWPGSTPAGGGCCAPAGRAGHHRRRQQQHQRGHAPDAPHQLAVGQRRGLELVVARQQLDVALLALAIVALTQLLQRRVAVLPACTSALSARSRWNSASAPRASPAAASASSYSRSTSARSASSPAPCASSSTRARSQQALGDALQADLGQPGVVGQRQLDAPVVVAAHDRQAALGRAQRVGRRAPAWRRRRSGRSARWLRGVAIRRVAPAAAPPRPGGAHCRASARWLAIWPRPA